MLLLLSESCRNLLHHWCEWWDLNPYVKTHAPQTCLSANSSTLTYIGADSGSRTHTMFPSKDFESFTSAYSITSAKNRNKQVLCCGIIACWQIILQRVQTTLSMATRFISIPSPTQIFLNLMPQYKAALLMMGCDNEGHRRWRSFLGKWIQLNTCLYCPRCHIKFGQHRFVATRGIKDTTCLLFQLVAPCQLNWNSPSSLSECCVHTTWWVCLHHKQSNSLRDSYPTSFMM